MKITDSEVIKNAEQELLDGIIADLDWNVVEQIIKEKHHLDLEEDVAFKKGDMVVFGTQIAYKLEFDVKLTLSILLDREGNHIATETGGSTENITSITEKDPGVEASEQAKTDSQEARDGSYEAALMSMDDAEYGKIADGDRSKGTEELNADGDNDTSGDQGDS